MSDPGQARHLASRTEYTVVLRQSLTCLHCPRNIYSHMVQPRPLAGVDGRDGIGSELLTRYPTRTDLDRERS